MYKTRPLTIVLFILPALTIFLMYMLIPIPLSAFYSLFQWDGITDMVFIGLKNWRELLNDSIFLNSVLNNFKLVFLSIITQIPIALLLAIFIYKKSRINNLLRTVYFLPQLFSSVAISVLWRYLYDPFFGLINEVLVKTGIIDMPIDFLGSEVLALYATSLAISWRFIPFYMILFIAAINGIPNELYEAARVDGANKFQTFFLITLPMLRSTIINAIVLVLVGSLKYFDIVYVLTEGGPNHASELMATYMYKMSFTRLKMGYGSAVAFALFLIAFSLSLLFLNLTRSYSAKKGD